MVSVEQPLVTLSLLPPGVMPVEEDEDDEDEEDDVLVVVVVDDVVEGVVEEVVVDDVLAVDFPVQSSTFWLEPQPSWKPSCAEGQGKVGPPFAPGQHWLPPHHAVDPGH